MAMLQKLYRKNITTENINTVGLYIDDEWKYQKESVPIQQFNTVSPNAIVIGNGITANQFDLTKILPYRETTPWGEVGMWKYKRQIKNFLTYGCNAIYRNYKPDFVIATGKDFVDELAQQSYCNENIVYTNNKYLELHPNKFNFIPQNPEYNAGAIAAYLAAFDGHQRVYMLGFDGIDNTSDNYNFFAGTPNYPPSNYPINEEFWVRSLNEVMSTYSDTEFIRVCPSKRFRQPESWKYNLNYKQIDFRQFVLEVGV
jgi:hypothetical protein